MKIYGQGTFQTLYEMPLEVNWALTDMCNYRCSYCFGQKPIDPDRFSTWEQIERAVEAIAALNRPHYTVTLTGGEPTIHPYFFETLQLFHEKLEERLDFVTIISNGSRNKKLYEHIAEISGSLDLVMNISIHTDHARLPHIEELVRLLSDRTQLRFSLMYNPARREYAQEIFERLVELRRDYPFWLHAVTLREPPSFDRADSRYTAEDFRWIEEANSRFTAAARESARKKKWKNHYDYYYKVAEDGEIRTLTQYNIDANLINGLHCFTGMECVFGLSVLNIKYDGRCYGAVCQAEQPSANVFAGNPLLEESWIHAVKCPYQNCGCSTNHKIPKFADEDEARHFVECCRRKQSELTEAVGADTAERTEHDGTAHRPGYGLLQRIFGR